MDSPHESEGKQMNLRIRLHFDRCDGWVFAVCKPGSWRPLMTFSSRGEALGCVR